MNIASLKYVKQKSIGATILKFRRHTPNRKLLVEINKPITDNTFMGY